MNHIAVGEKGEQTAIQYLLRNGYRILEHKYRTRTGEIDIIASVGDTIVFIEVKTRRSIRFGYPAEAVTKTKQRKIINTACCFLHKISRNDAPCRFDIIEVMLLSDNSTKCNHIQNAFGT